MNKNNQCYKMFKIMKEGYANNDINEVEHGARCWLDFDPENPFQINTPEYEAFFQMKKCYMIWKRGDIDRKINRRRMISWAVELCKLNPKQPYKYDKKAEEEELRLQKEAELTKVKSEPVVQPVAVVEQIEEKQDNIEKNEEKRNWLKFLFPWKKEGGA